MKITSRKDSEMQEQLNLISAHMHNLIVANNNLHARVQQLEMEVAIQAMLGSPKSSVYAVPGTGTVHISTKP